MKHSGKDVLNHALELQREAAAQGFDWSVLDDLWSKLDEEVGELRAALQMSPEDRHEELGDLLFMVVNLARHLSIDPVQALQDAVAKFERRYALIRANLGTLPPLGDPARLDAMEVLWQQAKQQEKAAAILSARKAES